MLERERSPATPVRPKRAPNLLRIGAALAAAFGAAACGLLIDTAGLSGPAPTSDLSDASIGPEGEGATDGGVAADVEAERAPSCRRLRERGATSSGAYTLEGPDGGRFPAYCEMEAFGGGWTLVTPSMVYIERRTQDLAPSSSASVDVVHTVSDRGGIGFSVTVTHVGCGGGLGPRHYALFAFQDWTQVMATYSFVGGFDCWNIFGDSELSGTNVFPFEKTKDLIDTQQNMTRSTAGKPLPYDGRTQFCARSSDNFWSSVYASSAKAARMVLRRNVLDALAGVGIAADCSGSGGGWVIRDI